MSMAAFYPKPDPSNGGEICRLLTAAVVNQRFRNLLLSNPQIALSAGYLGEPFRLAREEQDRVLSIRAKSLADFARQLTDSHSNHSHGSYHYLQSHRMNSP